MGAGTEVKCSAKPSSAAGPITITFDGRSVTANGVSEILVTFSVQPIRSTVNTEAADTETEASESSSDEDSFSEIETEVKSETTTGPTPPVMVIPPPPAGKPRMRAPYCPAMRPVYSDSTITPGVNLAVPQEPISFDSPVSPVQTESAPPSPAWPSILPPSVAPIMGQCATIHPETHVHASSGICGSTQPIPPAFKNSARIARHGMPRSLAGNAELRNVGHGTENIAGFHAGGYSTMPPLVQRWGSGVVYPRSGAYGENRSFSYPGWTEVPPASDHTMNGIPATASTRNVNNSIHSTAYPASYHPAYYADIPVTSGAKPSSASTLTASYPDSMHASFSSALSDTAARNAMLAAMGNGPYNASGGARGSGIGALGSYSHINGNASVPGAQYYF